MELIVKDLTHIYGQGSPYERIALDQVNLVIPSESFTAIIGPTGSGKSTLIQHFNGLLRPSSGEVQIGDTVITSTSKKMKLHALRKNVGLVFQYPEYQLFEETVEKDIAFGPLNYDLPYELAMTRVKEAMKVVGLEYDRFKDESPFKLSGGQKRRVALAGVLALQPQTLILDEPTAGLDPQGKRDILNQLYRLHRQEKWTTILVTHNMEDAAQYADQIVVLNDGQVFMQGTPAEIFEQEKRLRQISLDLPEISKFVRQLNEKLQSPLPTNIFSMDQLVNALLKRKKVGKR
ncbi:energy-coupling factor transporter ATPase [Ammoniphilus oxalaticus]|uniref:Energy-coupling factor transporter ATP-binding protein EcfA2 n=1 Tax=Ammoniphilus oxalaticus TaxID=66863 RepID=A0A419SFW3_9BACL|nr:energy-coupling factor transporter ATPase [Ammoniphilus oxalaticus]RKD22674.1 energy-coupling factor transporter ATPase [Ammoniphilus oxalaticus]